MRIRSLVLAILACGLGGCYNLQFQKKEPVAVPVAEPTPGSRPAPAIPASPAEEQAQTQDIGIIEFDDMGELWTRCDLSPTDSQPCQLTETLDWIKKERQAAAAKGRDSLVIVFVHGWNNNAQNGDPNLKDFATAIQLLRVSNRKLLIRCRPQQSGAADTSGPCDGVPKPVRYIGVYLGWRGRTFPGALNYLTPLGREKGAKRAASVSATEVLLRLREASKAKIGADDREGKFMVVGHSFGGLLVERAVAQALTEQIAGQIAHGDLSTRCSHDPQLDAPSAGNSSASHSETPQYRPLADLIVLINPAIEALETQELIDMMKRSCFWTPWIKNPGSNDGFHAPLLISIKARNDNATGSLFRAAHTVEEIDKAFRGYPDAPALSLPGEKNPSQRTVFASTVGYLSFYHNYCYVDDKGTHDDRDPVCNKIIDEVMRGRAIPTGVTGATADEAQLATSLPSCTPDGKYCQAFTWIPPSASDSHRLRHIYTRFEAADCTYSRCSVWNNTPYWSFTVPPNIINGHNGIWKNGFIDLLTDLVQAATPPPRPASSTTASPPGK
jgi:pimeloyl-ACP methyl ester carboxylesterase